VLNIVVILLVADLTWQVVKTLIDRRLRHTEASGVEQFGDYGIQIRLKMMTKPGEQFVIRRRALALIKTAFDENGIRFALPSVRVGGREEVQLGGGPPGSLVRRARSSGMTGRDERCTRCAFIRAGLIGEMDGMTACVDAITTLLERARAHTRRILYMESTGWPDN
jgi:hypothetical protein